MKFDFDSRIIVKVKGKELLNVSVLDMLHFWFASDKMYLSNDLLCDLFVTDSRTGESYISEFASADLCNHKATHVSKPIIATICTKCNRLVRATQ